MLFIIVTFCFLCPIFFINRHNTRLNHAIIHFFLENKLINKILENTLQFQDSASFATNIKTLEDFFEVKIFLYDTGRYDSDKIIPNELLKFISLEKKNLVENNSNSEKLTTKYIIDSKENVKKIHFISYKISNPKREVILIIQEQFDSPLSSFDINSSMPLFSKLICIIYGFETSLSFSMN